MKCSGCWKTGKDLTCIKCTSAACEKYYCSLCINISTISSERKKTWKCPDCLAAAKKGGDNSSTPVRGVNESSNVTTRKKTDSSLDTSDVKELTAEVRLLTREISSLKHRLEEATQSLTHCHSRLDELGVTVAANEARINGIEEREKEMLSLKTAVTFLKRDLNTQAQGHLRNELEISGVPENQTENLHHIILVAAKKIGVQLVDEDIDWVTRVGARTPVTSLINNATPNPRPIVVRLTRRAKRDSFLKASKSRKNLLSKDLEIQGPAHKVYFNERLTKENRLLFREARIRAKAHGYAYCWCNQGVIYIRQREGKAALHVSSQENLDNMLSAC